MEVQEDMNDEDDEAEVEDALVEDAADAAPTVDEAQKRPAEVCWQGDAIHLDAGKKLYRSRPRCMTSFLALPAYLRKAQGQSGCQNFIPPIQSVLLLSVLLDGRDRYQPSTHVDVMICELLVLKTHTMS